MQFMVNTLITCSLYFTLSVSFWLVFRSVRFFHLAHGSLYTAGAYAAIEMAEASRGWGWGSDSPFSTILLCSLAAVAVAAGLGFTVNLIVYEKLRNRRASALIFMLASFGVLVFCDNLVALIFGSDLRLLRLIAIRPGWEVAGAAVITTTQVALLLFSMTLLIGGTLVGRTRLARALNAVAMDPLGASIVGIDPVRLIRQVMVLGSALAGLGGMLFALETNVRPTIGFQLLYKAIVVSILGGQRIWGLFLASLILSILEHGADRVFAGSWREGVSLVMLLAFLLGRRDAISRTIHTYRPD